ncbi:MAG: DUF4430 domain-containing protein [Oscillospiraceae bacterium]|nr:DUF4430 domain-containing protein [Oscillospiraceae bacterium]
MKTTRTTKCIAASLLSAAVMAGASVCAFAQEQPEGYIVFAADKNTICQGFVTEPVRVPFYEGEKAIDVVKRAADVIVTESDYGDYISAFADPSPEEDIMFIEFPSQLLEVMPEEVYERTKAGYLSNYDFTPEAGWSFFINDEYAQVGITDYSPEDGDVVWFRFTVYGYGCDLGIDNTSWGGNPAVVPQTDTAAIMTLIADNAELSDTDEYKNAIAVLETYGASQADIDGAEKALAEAAAPEIPEDTAAPEDTETPETGKGSPDTGAEGIAAVVGVAVLAGAALALSKRR